MAVNSNGIEDEDGDRSDWIELFNAGSTPVNLGGWHLTDKASDLTKWEISPVILNPGDYLIIWASNKNRKDPDEELHTNFKLSGSGEYLALVKPDGVTVVSDFSPEYPAQTDDISYGVESTSAVLTVLSSNAACSVHVPSSDALGLTWTELNFDDSTWISGTTGIGYDNTIPGYNPLINLDVGNLMYELHPSIYTRIPFMVPEGLNISSATLRMRYDDGFRAYLNGEPIASANITGSYSWDEDAPQYLESTDFVEFTLSSGNDFQSGANILSIHGVNDRNNSSDFLLLPELTVVHTSTSSTMDSFYFTSPTPGSGNFGGTENIGPQFSKEQHLPFQPLETEDLEISVRVVDVADGVTAVDLTYEIMFDGEITVPMLGSNGIYTASIPSSTFNAGEMIRYRFMAADGAGNTSRWPQYYDPLNSPEFFGTMAQIDVPSSMPVYHWFIEDTANMDTGNESRSSIFYDGILYDNIITRIRGGSTENANILKKSHKFDFNLSHHFEYDSDERKVEEVNLNTTYSDKTYLRRMLAWKSYEAVDAPGCKSFLVHLRRNNAFFGVQNFEEQVDDDFLQRHNYDENGKLYKITGWYDDPATGYKAHHVAQKTRREDTDSSDVHTLIEGIQTSNKESYAFDHMDVANLINYVALTTLMRDGDTAAKNHYLYRDTDGTGEWTIFPWDKDLTYGMSWKQGVAILHDGCDPANHLQWPSWGLYPKLVWESPDLKVLYLRRLRSILDQLLQQSSTPVDQRYYESLISELLSNHHDDLQQDFNAWGNPWKFGEELETGEANTNKTINGFLNPSRNYFYGQSSLPAEQAPSPSIQISHVEAVPTSGNQLEEYIELYNPNSIAVDISGWSLSNAVEHVFRGGSVILPNNYFYISPDTGAFRRRSTSPKGGEKRFVQGSYKGMLSSRGETLELYDSTGTLKDSETWTEDLSDAQRYLRISEIMYHPALPDGAEITEDRLEFIELKNTGSSPLNIGGTHFSAGLIFTNPAVTIPSGGYLVIASDLTVFSQEHDTSGITVVGDFSGYLANGNDTIELEDARGETIQRFEYNDDWFDNTDGQGFSLTLIDPAETNLSIWNDKVAWRPSLNPGGSPGTDDDDLTPGSIVINEVLAHSDTGDDWIEFKNLTSTPIDLSHWYVSDDPSDLEKYQLPNGTTLPANGFTLIHEADFNSGTTAFALSELGDEVILNRAQIDGTLQGFQTSHDFNATGKDISLGRWIDSEGDTQFIPMSEQTPGSDNTAPKTDPVLISEIMYHPSSNQAEYIELYNRSQIDQPLYDPDYPTNSWSISGAIDYTFPEGQTLPSGTFVIICSTNPLAFKAQYSIPDHIQVFGPYGGQLNNSGERIRLYYPGNPEPTFVPQIQLESVNYKSEAPWPVITAGQSIERISTIHPANDPASWRVTSPTPGKPTTTALPITDVSNDWKNRHFGSTSSPGTGSHEDFDVDGIDNLSEFIAGTDPADSNDIPRVSIMITPEQNTQVSIPTTRAHPDDHFGLQRYYSLIQSADLNSQDWKADPAADEIFGTGQDLVIVQTSGTNSTGFTKALIELK